ncbi:MAG: phage holin family protein [Candidatus Methylacidiphilales bacterium]
MDSLRRLLDAFLRAVETRMDLFAVELQEEKIRLIHIVLWTCSAVFLSALSLIMVTLTVVILLRPEYREEALILFCILYLAAAVFSVFKLRKILYTGEVPFAETMSQLKKDREIISPKS